MKIYKLIVCFFLMSFSFNVSSQVVPPPIPPPPPPGLPIDFGIIFLIITGSIYGFFKSKKEV